MNNFNTILCQSDVSNSRNYWKSINLYIHKPHIVNRKLIGAEILIVLNYTGAGHQFINNVKNICDRLIETVSQQATIDDKTTLKIVNDLDLADEFETLQEHDLLNILETSSNPMACAIAVNKLIPKNANTNTVTYELIVFDLQKTRTTFMGLKLIDQTHDKIGQTNSFTIGLQAEPTPSLSICVLDNEINLGLHRWLQFCLLPKLTKWMDSLDEIRNGLMVDSLSLIDIEEYTNKYNELKLKYGKQMVEIWPETTDPQKFVYEDVAIASYLLVLWKQERDRQQTSKLQSFADLGCGNGLLVYILSSEGHSGHGIDVRKRGIWDIYPATTILKTEAIVPSEQSLFPNIDWIIGNHSDELSPWIPVIAARSSYNCRYFLLPCCAYNFSGRKYQRKSAQKSQYNCFLDYAQEISNVCGFQTQIDRLKIPSTKRICLIGGERTYTENAAGTHDQTIQRFIDQQSGEGNKSNAERVTATDAWNAAFVPRSNVEKVQNCTKINKQIEQEIIDIVFLKLLTKKRFSDEFIKPEWNVGGRILLVDLARELTKKQLKELKSECGGLQTLLKNNSQIFKVYGGHVEIRLPIKCSEKLKELENRRKPNENKSLFKFKIKPCFFFSNHPDGCPFDVENCCFKH